MNCGIKDMSSISKYFPGRSKRAKSSSSSISDTWSSLDRKKHNKTKKKKKPRKDSVHSSRDDIDIQEALEDIRRQLAQQVTKDDIRSLREEMNQLTDRLDIRIEQLESVVFDLRNERDVLDSEVKSLKKENGELREKVEQCVKANDNIKRDLNVQEQHGRQFNVRVYGVAEARGSSKETVEDCVRHCAEIFTNKIKVPVTKEDIEIAHRTGRPGGTRPRPIIVRFHFRRLRGLVLADRRKLKQTGVSVGEDLTQPNYLLLRKASQHLATLAAWSSNGKILAKTKNGKTIKLDVNMNVDAELIRAMT